MRENRTYGSEGGEARSLPYPYQEMRQLGRKLLRTNDVHPQNNFV